VITIVNVTEAWAPIAYKEKFLVDDEKPSISRLNKIIRIERAVRPGYKAKAQI
jgi:ribosomal protein L15E